MALFALTFQTVGFALLLASCSAGPGAVGAIFAQSNRDGTVHVRSVPAGLPAARAGLRTDDEVLLVDGCDVRDLSADDLHRALQGPPGSTVRLTLRRGADIERVELIRAEIGSRGGAAP